MTLPRFFVPIELKVGVTASLNEDVSHYLRHVLRIGTDEEVILFNGNGGEYRSRINTVTKKAVNVTPEKFAETNRSGELSVHLGLSVLKRDAMDNAIGRAVELGATKITPVISEHVTVASKVITRRTEHWQKVVYSACEQCGLNRVPRIEDPTEVADWVTERDEETKLLTSIGAPPLPLAGKADGAIALLIGPEGGLTAAEVSHAVGKGFTRMGLGERILRAETVPLVALSVLQRTWGDYSPDSY